MEGYSLFQSPTSDIVKPSRSALTVFLVSGLTFIGLSAEDSTSSDYLSPLERLDERTASYQLFLTKKLGLTPFDCGRVVDEPSFAPESIVSVYSKKQNGRLVFYVSTVQAAENLWDRSRSMRDLAQAEAVGISRADAEIPESIAEHIRKAWLRMLQQARPWQRPRLEFELAGYLRFSIEQPQGQTAEAELWLPPRGPRTRAIVKISEDLREYCKATPESRPTIAGHIERDTSALLAELAVDSDPRP